MTFFSNLDISFGIISTNMYFPLSSNRSLVTGNVESNVPYGESVGSKEEEMVHAQLENDETDGNFENIKARLRPRKAQIDYFKVNVVSAKCYSYR